MYIALEKCFPILNLWLCGPPVLSIINYESTPFDSSAGSEKLLSIFHPPFRCSLLYELWMINKYCNCQLFLFLYFIVPTTITHFSFLISFITTRTMITFPGFLTLSGFLCILPVQNTIVSQTWNHNHSVDELWSKIIILPISYFWYGYSLIMYTSLFRIYNGPQLAFFITPPLLHLFFWSRIIIWVS